MEHAYDENVFESLAGPLRACEVKGFQVNLGRRCNQSCHHCHLEASPERREEMEWGTMLAILRVVDKNKVVSVQLTGGAPELNPNLQPFIIELRRLNARVKVRSNLTVLLEQGLEGLAAFFRERDVQIVASLPCYLEKNVESQRGEGVFDKSIAALQMLNGLGYGTGQGPDLEIVFNPGGPFLPGSQRELEALYRRELKNRYGVTFTRLLTITNMPIGRFRSNLQRQKQAKEYLRLLYSSFNRGVLDKLMCRRNVSVDWDGNLYDCDFNLALGIPLSGPPLKIDEFDQEFLAERPIVTREHCLGCTAGPGSSCQGALEVGRK